MIAVKVTYTVKPSYVQTNKENIHSFMKEFQGLNSSDFRYTVFLADNGKTFIHLSMYQNEKVQRKLLNIESFKSFQKQRDESGLEIPPDLEEIKLVDSSYSIFK